MQSYFVHQVCVLGAELSYEVQGIWCSLFTQTICFSSDYIFFVEIVLFNNSPFFFNMDCVLFF